MDSPEIIRVALWCLFGYLMGSCPTGYIAVRAMTGEDIRNFGSGNIGATNVSRVLGRGWAIFTAVFDMVKGGAAVLFAIGLGESSPAALAGIGCAAVLGHDYPVWLGFRGGKGVATSFGVIAFYDFFNPLPAIIGGAVWFAAREVSRYVSFASLAGLAASAAAMTVLAPSPAYGVASFALLALTAVRHKENIRRLIAGTENTVQPLIPKFAAAARIKFTALLKKIGRNLPR